MKMAPLNANRMRNGVGREWAAMAEACRVPDDDDDDEGSSPSSIWNDSSSSAPDIILKRTVVCCHLSAGAIGWRPSSCALALVILSCKAKSRASSIPGVFHQCTYVYVHNSVCSSPPPLPRCRRSFFRAYLYK